jgi:hypothetical protein
MQRRGRRSFEQGGASLPQCSVGLHSELPAHRSQPQLQRPCERSGISRQRVPLLAQGLGGSQYTPKARAHAGSSFRQRASPSSCVRAPSVFQSARRAGAGGGASGIGAGVAAGAGTGATVRQAASVAAASSARTARALGRGALVAQGGGATTYEPCGGLGLADGGGPVVSGISR